MKSQKTWNEMYGIRSGANERVKESENERERERERERKKSLRQNDGSNLQTLNAQYYGKPQKPRM